MRISNEKYAQALLDLLQNVDDLTEVKKIIGNFLTVLEKNNDWYKLDRVLKEFVKIWNQEFRVINAELTTVHDLGAEAELMIKEYISKKVSAEQINFMYKNDKNILGGVVIKYGDKIFDASLLNRLNRLKEFLLK